MIIYKYQYEKECVLKKTHGYWCLNNCSVKEMERGGKMWIIFSQCVCREKKRHLIEHIPRGANSEVKDKIKKHFYDFFFSFPFCRVNKTPDKYEFSCFVASICPRCLDRKRDKASDNTEQITASRSAFFFSTLVFFNLFGHTLLYLHFKYSYLKMPRCELMTITRLKSKNQKGPLSIFLPTLKLNRWPQWNFQIKLYLS